MRLNMRLRLIVSLTLVSLVAILAMVVVIRQEARGRVQTYLYRGGMFGADRLVTALETYHQSTGSWDGIGSRMEELQSAPGMGMMRGMTARGLRAYRLYDAVGALVWDGAGAQQGGSSLTPAERDRNIRLRSTAGETIGYLVVEGAPALLPQADEEGLVNILNEAAVRAGMISGVAAVLVALVLGAGLLRPIRQVTAAAKKIASGDLSQRVPVQGDDELASLAQSFNTMTESLQRSEERRQRMTADIAHELRTPLAVQRAHLEALQDGIYDLNPQNMQPILEQTELLSRLVEDLRTLALVDAGELQLERRWVDLPEVAVGAVQRFRSSAEMRGIEIRWNPDETGAVPPVWGDRDRLAQILNNLLSNALRYTPDGGWIQLELEQQAGWLTLTVHDNGPGIPYQTLPYIFDRFYRADASRSREEGGSGLGLAIARRLAQAHNGELNAANHPQGGAMISLRLPAGSQQRTELFPEG